MAGKVDEAASGIEVREYRPGDEHGILELFRDVFRVERSLAHWRWKFEGNPGGREIIVAVDRSGRIVGQFASLPSRGRIGGRDAVISQLLDHMVARDMHRRGVYAAMARAFHGRFVAADPRAAYFGFNLEEIFRIESRLYGMELLHAVAPLTRYLEGPEREPQGRTDDPAGPEPLLAGAPTPGRSLMAKRFIRVERIERVPTSADTLWARACPRYAAAITRDAAYLEWRYARCPDVEYVLLAARHLLTRRIMGIAVVRLGWILEPIAALVDWVVPGATVAVWAALLAEADRLAGQAGFREIRAWLPPGSPDRPVLERFGYLPAPSPFLVSAWADGRQERPVAALRTGWHYTMGDTDIY